LKELVFDAFSDSEPVERAYIGWHGNDMTGLRGCNDNHGQYERESSESAGDGIIETWDCREPIVEIIVLAKLALMHARRTMLLSILGKWRYSQ